MLLFLYRLEEREVKVLMEGPQKRSKEEKGKRRQSIEEDAS